MELSFTFTLYVGKAGAYQSGPHYETSFRFLALRANIRLGWKQMAVENALTYYDAATVTATKCFIVQGPVVGKARSRLDVTDAYSV